MIRFSLYTGLQKLGIQYTQEIHLAIQRARGSSEPEIDIDSPDMDEATWNKVLFPPPVHKPTWEALEDAGTVFFARQGFLFKEMMDDYEDLDIANKEPLNKADWDALNIENKPTFEEIIQAAEQQKLADKRTELSTTIYDEKKRQICLLFGFEEGKKGYEKYLLHKIRKLEGDPDAVALDDIHATKRAKIIQQYNQLKTEMTTKTIEELLMFDVHDQKIWE